MANFGSHHKPYIMTYKLLQTVEYKSRFLNMDQVVSIHVEVLEEVANGHLDYMVCFITTSSIADCKVKFDTMQDAVDYVAVLTGIIPLLQEIEIPRPVVTGFNGKR